MAEPLMTGDGPEYAMQAEGIAVRGSPAYDAADRSAADCDSLGTWDYDPNDHYSGVHVDPRPTGFYRGRNGALYARHFWAYSACAVPFRWIAAELGERQPAFLALHWLNILCLTAGAACCLLGGGLSPGRRALLACLATGGPILLYVRWPSPEVWTWSLMMAGVVTFSRSSWFWSALWFGTASTQNPPILLFALATVWMAASSASAGDRVRSRSLTSTGALVGLTSFAFNLWAFGTVSPLVRCKEASLSHLSLTETLDIYLGLDQGYLGRTPLLAVLFVISVWIVLKRRRAPEVALLVALGAVSVALTTNANWNNGCAGLMRYAAWLLPVVCYLIAALLPKQLVWLGGAAVLAQAWWAWTKDGVSDENRHSAIAELVLDRWPALYVTTPEIFVEREIGHGVTPFAPPFPVVHRNASGRVTKALLKIEGRYRFVNWPGRVAGSVN